MKSATTHLLSTTAMLPLCPPPFHHFGNHTLPSFSNGLILSYTGMVVKNIINTSTQDADDQMYRLM
ncbi:hypothetical protein [Salibacterium halotolerans]|uniref:hypothetical protein n=1 Tax=Salibacterium halotolerans TaxID=1884432 RepID=UPI00147B49E3|nr:hypothetical protein [Salibacterium halotolerans]